MFSLLCYFICEIKDLKLIFIYMFGYLACSCIIQYISLREEIKKLYKETSQNKENIRNNEINIVDGIIDRNVDILLPYIGCNLNISI